MVAFFKIKVNELNRGGCEIPLLISYGAIVEPPSFLIWDEHGSGGL